MVFANKISQLREDRKLFQCHLDAALDMDTRTSISKVLPPVSRFTPTGDRTKKRDTVIEKLTAFFNKFWDISGGKFSHN